MSILKAIFKQSSPGKYVPSPRFAHYAFAHGSQSYLYGGRTKDFSKDRKEELSSTVEVFDIYTEQWRLEKSCGTPPKGLYGGACCSSPTGDFYFYGGTSDGAVFCAGLNKLEYATLKWSQLSDNLDVNKPMLKTACRMVFFMKRKLALFGGYGPPPASIQLGANFVEDRVCRGWTNEFHFFDLEKGTAYLLTLSMQVQEGYGSLFVCLSVCVSVAMPLSSTWYIYKLKVRYHWILHKSFDLSISLNMICSRDMALLAYCNDP